MFISATQSKPQHIRAVIVDLDGTMLDTVPDFDVAINRMRHELQLSAISRDDIALRIGKGSEVLIRTVLAMDYDAAGVEQRFQRAFDSYKRHYLDINGQHAVLYPGVVEGLQAFVEQGLRVACVTNKPIAFTTPLLAQKDLARYFELVYGGDSLARKKPDPLPMLQVCQDFNIAPHQVVAIGDSSNDAQAARAAGCFVLTVPYGYNHGESIHDSDSDGVVDSLLVAAERIRAHNLTAA